MTAAAGIATLEALTPDVYRHLNGLGDDLRGKLAGLFIEREAPMCVTGLASLFCMHATTEQVRDYRSAATGDPDLRRTIFLGLLNEGFLISQRGLGCISAAHTESDVDDLVGAVGRVLERAGYG
jgi:glutamate-1-semialdehyde 2,1-aminomutase